MVSWTEILNTIILSVIGVVVSSLGALLMGWIFTKIKHEKFSRIANEASLIVKNGVYYVYQTYVENRKGTELWDEDAKITAQKQATYYIQQHLTEEIIKYLKNGNIQIEQWIQEQIEIAVKESKENSKVK